METPLPPRAEEHLRRLAGQHGLDIGLLRRWYAQFDADGLIRERFQGRPEEERVDYMLLILEERIGEHKRGTRFPRR